MSTEGTQEQTVPTLEQFKHSVRVFVDIDNEIKTINETMSSMKKKKKDLEKCIMLYMNSNSLSRCNISDGGNLMVKKTKTVTSLKRKNAQDLLQAELGDSAKADRLTAMMFDNRPTNEGQRLYRRIVNPRGKADDLEDITVTDSEANEMED